MATPRPVPAHQQGAVDLALGDQLGGGDGAVRVGGLVVGAVAADVDDGLDPRVRLEVGLDLVLVADAGVLGE